VVVVVVVVVVVLIVVAAAAVVVVCDLLCSLLNVCLLIQTERSKKALGIPEELEPTEDEVKQAFRRQVSWW